MDTTILPLVSFLAKTVVFFDMSNGKMPNSYNRNAYNTNFNISCILLRPLGEATADLLSQWNNGSVVEKNNIRS